MIKRFPYGKSVFLTGGSSGIGLATAELLAEAGYVVYCASRHPKPDVRTFPSAGAIHPVKMDVCSMDSIKEAAETVLAKEDIGIIIHSAGFGIASPAENFPAQSVQSLMDTNFMGVLRTNSIFLPHLRARGEGMCIMVSSVASLFAIPFQSHYCSSKAALEAYAATLRMELTDYNINVSLVLPGDTNTGFTSARSYEIDKNSPYYKSCIKSVAKMEKDEQGGKPASSVAKVISKLLTKRNPPLRAIVGFDYKCMAFARRLLPDRLVEYILKKMYMG